jgi:hypothetical protein
MNWRGIPLVSHETIVILIAATTTKKDLRVKAELDCELYRKGIKVTDENLETVRIFREEIHDEWNESILPAES